MRDKKLTNLYISDDVINHFTRKAQAELEDEGEPVNKITIQRKRSRLMVDLLTECYEAEDEEE